MAEIDLLLIDLLRAGAPAQVQHLAAAAAPTSEHKFLLWSRLAKTPRLDPALWEVIATCDSSGGREALWQRDDLDLALLVRYLPTEMDHSVLTAMLKRARGAVPLRQVLPTPLTPELAQALLGLELAGLPADIVTEAARAYPETEALQRLAGSGHDLGDLVSDPSVDPSVRLAACASGGTPDHLVATHLEGILRAIAIPRREHEELLSALAARPVHAGIAEAARRAGGLSGNLRPVVTSQLAWWDDRVVSQMGFDMIKQRIDAVRSAEELRLVWGLLDDRRQLAQALNVYAHRDCDAELARDIRELAPETPAGMSVAKASAGGFPLWMMQDPASVATLTTRPHSPWFRTLRVILEEAAERAGALPLPVLASAAFDMVLAGLNRPGSGTKEQDCSWVLTHPALPPERLDEAPLRLLQRAIAELSDDDSPLSPGALRLVDHVNGLLAPFADDPTVSIAMLRSAVDAHAPAGALLRAARTAL